MKRLILTIGAPASGKSTWAQTRAKEYDGVTIAERDQIREEYAKSIGRVPWDKDWGDEEEKEVTAIQTSKVVSDLERFQEVIVSDTNLNLRTRLKWQHMAKELGVELIHVRFPVFHNVLLRCNAKRESWKRVPDKIMNRMIINMVENFPVGVNDNAYYGVSNGGIQHGSGIGTFKGVVVDLDGTLAEIHDRSPYEDEKVEQDRINSDVLDVVKGLHSLGYDITIMSGRDEGRSRAPTRRWLNAHGVPYNRLYMRPPGDSIKDNVVKHDLMIGLYEVHGAVPCMAIDDRDQVVRLWRDMGIRCLQVADGNF